MERRTFLNVCIGTGVAAAQLAWPGVLDQGAGDGAGWQVTGRALCPGAPLQVTVAADVPPGSRVRVLVDHAGRSHQAALVAAPPGAVLALETPYPFADLVPGDYAVHLALEGRHGEPLATCPVGTYCLQRFRFSV